MHPIERLRVLARDDEVPHAELAAETAGALAALGDDSRGMLAACRQMLARHPEAGPLWWACARMLSADDPEAEARAIRRNLADDAVGLSLALDLPQGIEVAIIGWSPLVNELAGRREDLKLNISWTGGLTFVEANLDTFHDPSLETYDPDIDDRVFDLKSHELVRSVERCEVLLVDVWVAGDKAFFSSARNKEAMVAAHRCGTEAWAMVGVGRRLPEPLFEVVRQRIRTTATPRLVAADHTINEYASRVIEPVSIPCPCPPELLHLS